MCKKCHVLNPSWGHFFNTRKVLSWLGFFFLVTSLKEQDGPCSKMLEVTVKITITYLFCVSLSRGKVSYPALCHHVMQHNISVPKGNSSQSQYYSIKNVTQLKKQSTCAALSDNSRTANSFRNSKKIKREWAEKTPQGEAQFIENGKRWQHAPADAALLQYGANFKRTTTDAHAGCTLGANHHSLNVLRIYRLSLNPITV